MVKTPRTRHSKSAKQPVTIELEVDEVVDHKAGDTSAEPDGNSDYLDSETAAASSSETSKSENGESAGTTENETDSSPAEPEPKDEKRKSSTAGLVAAGVVGGVLALGGNAALNLTGILSAGDDDRASQIAAIEERISGLGAVVQNKVDAAGEAVRTEMREAIAAVKAETDSKISSAASDVDALKSDLMQLRSALESGEGGDQAGLLALKGRVDEMEQKLAGITQPPAGSGDSQTLDEIKTGLDEIRSAVSSATESAEAANKSASANATEIAGLRTELGELGRRVEQQGSSPEVALAIAAAALKSAIDRGLPFMTELETYAAVAPDAPEIEALRELAASGVPTRGDISAGMAGAANSMIAAANVVDAEAGFFERLLASAQSLIKVRPIGMVEGDTVAAIIARMEVAVNDNDLARAIAEFETLPETAKAAGQDFAAGMRARIKADELIDTALAAALRPGNG